MAFDLLVDFENQPGCIPYIQNTCFLVLRPIIESVAFYLFALMSMKKKATLSLIGLKDAKYSLKIFVYCFNVNVWTTTNFFLQSSKKKSINVIIEDYFYPNELLLFVLGFS